MIFVKDYEFGLSDVNEDSKITNKAILNMLGDVAGKHADSIGNGLNDRTEYGWVILDWKVKVIKRPKYGQQLNVLTWGQDTNKCSINRDFEVYDDDNNLCIIATSKWVLVNIKTRRLERIPEDLIKRYEPEFGTTVFENEKLSKISPIEKVENEIEYKVLRRDIDVNGHMHNLYYLDFAYEVLPEDVYKNQKFDNIRIMFKKEVLLGNKIKCKYEYFNNNHKIQIESEDGKTIHSIIELS